jgi:hypothetical protein
MTISTVAVGRVAVILVSSGLVRSIMVSPWQTIGGKRPAANGRRRTAGLRVPEPVARYNPSAGIWLLT